jgi:hypothetical protein
MTALRICDGAVSSEQRKINGASAATAPARRAGAATVAIPEATNARRDHDDVIFIPLKALGG